MTQNLNISVTLVVLVIMGLVLYFCFFNRDEKKDAPLTPAKESYANIGAIDNLGSLDGSYELLPAPEELVPATHFADLVDTGDHVDILKQPYGSADAIRPLERLERLQTQRMLPSTAKNVTPYAVDVADVTTYSFSVNAPRVTLKNRLWGQSDPYRGDLPITYQANISLIGKSQYGRDSWRGDGFFSNGGMSLYNKLVGKAYKNLPLQTSVKGTVMDYSQ